MQPALLGGIDIALILTYVAGLLVIGYVVSRHIRGFDDFFVAGHRMTIPLLICTLVSTYYGLDVLFGGSEVAYQEGVVAWFAYTRPYYVVILVAAFLVAPRLRRYPFRSLPDAMGHFYGNGARAISAVASFLYSLPFMALMGIGVLLDVVMGIPFATGVLVGAIVSLAYTLLGGLPAAAITDTLQFVLMCVTLGIAAMLTLDDLGGLDGLQAAVPPEFFSATGTYPPAVLIVFAATALSVLVEPAFYQRIFAAKNTRSILVALLIGIALWAAFDWIVTVQGMAAAAAGIETDPTYALLTVTLHYLPVGLKGLFVVGVLATAMSTIDSYLLIAGGNVAYDFYRPIWKPEMSDREMLSLTRWMAAAAAGVGVVLALYFQTIVSAWIFISSLLTATVLVPLMGALFASRQPRRAAGVASSLAGLVTAVGFYILVTMMGSYDPEWETVIWVVGLGDRVVPIWQEYALLLALPVSAIAFAAGQLFGSAGGPTSGTMEPAVLGGRSAGGAR
jgi:solute:Na+ symporter, SSS family